MRVIGPCFLTAMLALQTCPCCDAWRLKNLQQQRRAPNRLLEPMTRFARLECPPQTTLRRALRELCGILWRSECSVRLRKPASTHRTGEQVAWTTYRASFIKTGGPLPLTESPTQWQAWCAQVRWAASALPVPSPGLFGAPLRRAWWTQQIHVQRARRSAAAGLPVVASPYATRLCALPGS